MRDWLYQVGRALTRLLNALLGGEGDTSFSARTEAEARAGRPGWVGVAMLIDAVMGHGHTAAAHAWHAERGLLDREVP